MSGKRPGLHQGARLRSRTLPPAHEPIYLKETGKPRSMWRANL